MENFVYAKTEEGLSREEIRAALLASLEGRTLKNVLIIPPDFTRFHSNAGYITNVYYHALVERGWHGGTDFLFCLCQPPALEQVTPPLSEPHFTPL